MQVCRADSYRVMPWKNGGGSTTEIAVSPAGASLDEFDWRLSMARIERDGPFSAFPGIDRTLTLLDGARVELEVAGRGVTLTADQPTLRFAGEDRVTATIPAGSIIDFNVMTRRTRCSHRFHQIDVIGRHSVARGSGTTILFLARGAALTCHPEDGSEVQLTIRDCLILPAEDPTSWLVEVPTPATLFHIEIV